MHNMQKASEGSAHTHEILSLEQDSTVTSKTPTTSMWSNEPEESKQRYKLRKLCKLFPSNCKTAFMQLIYNEFQSLVAKHKLSTAYNDVITYRGRRSEEWILKERAISNFVIWPYMFSL